MYVKVIFWIIIIVVAGGLSYQIYTLARERETLKKKALEATAKLQTLEEEEQKLRDESIYYGDIRNLSKELKSLFNYKKLGEHMLIIVPEKSN